MLDVCFCVCERFNGHFFRTSSIIHKFVFFAKYILLSMYTVHIFYAFNNFSEYFFFFFCWCRRVCVLPSIDRWLDNNLRDYALCFYFTCNHYTKPDLCCLIELLRTSFIIIEMKRKKFVRSNKKARWFIFSSKTSKLRREKGILFKLWLKDSINIIKEIMRFIPLFMRPLNSAQQNTECVIGI